MAEKINLNTAGVKLLTQLPGVSKTVAYHIVNHRGRHGLFTNWDELKEVKEFPVESLDDIKARADLGVEQQTPRHLNTTHMAVVAKKPAGYTKAIRTTRRQDKLRAS
jgi:Helix-hairpin-helix motif